MELPTAEELERREAEHRAKIASTSSHELARALLALPEGKVIFVGASHGPYTQDLGLQTLPWHVDWANEIRMHVGDTGAHVHAHDPSDVESPAYHTRGDQGVD